jgi:hypothetical protein
MKMYFVEVECIGWELPILPKEFEHVRVVRTGEVVNGNHIFRLNLTDKELLIKSAEYLGFQDAKEFVTEEEMHEDSQFVVMTDKKCKCCGAYLLDDLIEDFNPAKAGYCLACENKARKEVGIRLIGESDNQIKKDYIGFKILNGLIRD